jgi:hypothetical protein
MFLGSVIVSAVLAAVLAASAAMKLSHRPDIVDRYARVGVPESRLNRLAGILILGAVGLVAGLAWPLIGVAAAAGLAVYFVVAIAAHIRAGDTANLLAPVAIEILSILALVLRLASLKT